MKHLVYILLLTYANQIYCHNKYSKSANTPTNQDDDLDFRPAYLQHLNKPFRMSKLNLLWSKAVIRLSEPKLKSLFSDLKLHDKLEITHKHEKAEGKDKDGLRQAELRNKLKTIMTNYDLLDQLDSINDPKQLSGHKALNNASDKYLNKSIFRDKKLNKLWEKIEHSGFTPEELETLKQEFQHHQDKIDQYYSLLHDVKNDTKEAGYENSIDDKLEIFNEIPSAQGDNEPKKDYLDKVNLIRDQHNNIKDGFHRLTVLASKGPGSKDFLEPKVEGLWKIALESNFSPEELESLRVELLHYENRLIKLRHLQSEDAMIKGKYGAKVSEDSFMRDQIKKHARKVDKIHIDIESRILERHGGEL